MSTSPPRSSSSNSRSTLRFSCCSVAVGLVKFLGTGPVHRINCPSMDVNASMFWVGDHCRPQMLSPGYERREMTVRESVSHMRIRDPDDEARYRPLGDHASSLIT